MAITSIIVFGESRNNVHSWGKSVQSECEKQGANMKGPMPLPQVTISYDGEDYRIHLTNVEDNGDNWFDRIHLSEEEKNELFPESGDKNSIFGRAIEIEADDVASSVLDTELDGDLFLRAIVEKSDIPDSAGSHSHGYDPNTEYVTDVDFDANHR